jgi:disulfide oxidoreductase YuzD
MAKIIINGKDDRVVLPASKYRFKKEFEDSIITLRGRSRPITKSTLQDSDVEMIRKKVPQYLFNFELVPTEEEQTVEAEQQVIEEVQIEQPVFGTIEVEQDVFDEEAEEPAKKNVKPASKPKSKGSKK